MKKAAICLAVVLTGFGAFAWHGGHHGGWHGGYHHGYHGGWHHHHYHGGWGWGRGGCHFWPGFVGGVVGGAVAASYWSRPYYYDSPVVVAQPSPVVVQSSPVVVQQAAPAVVQQPVVVPQVVPTVRAPQQVWVEGCYIDQIQANGTTVRVWNPGHYETR